ncbi:Eukaryotic translation initiation factor 2D-like protein [Drosera capensis]
MAKISDPAYLTIVWNLRHRNTDGGVSQIFFWFAASQRAFRLRLEQYAPYPKYALDSALEQKFLVTAKRAADSADGDCFCCSFWDHDNQYTNVHVVLAMAMNKGRNANGLRYDCVLVGGVISIFAPNMFKKALETRSLQRLSGADKKKLRRKVKEKFPRASDADIDVILPPKVEITVTKLQNRVVVYGVEGDLPMIFDIDGRGSGLHPTVYALWKVPNLLPYFTLKGGEVSRFIIGGADLMFPGIIIPPEGLPSFAAGETWAVKVPGNPAPIAVGVTTMNSTEAVKASLRGKALKITNHYHDTLWQAYILLHIILESVEGRYVPNAGFYDDVVFADPTFSSSEGDVSVDQDDEVADKEAVDATVATDIPSDLEATATEHGIASSNTTDQLATEVDNLKLAEPSSNDEPNVEGQTSMSAEDVDKLLDRCLLQALHTTVKDKDLPMLGSSLWSHHVLPCRPPGITLDIKKSSYKKLSKWLLSKCFNALIDVKEDKHKNEVILTSVNRQHAEYTSFKPEKRVAEKKDEAAIPATNENKSPLLEIVEIYKPSSHVAPIFASVGADAAGFYTAQEASAVVFRYVEKEGLVKPTDKSLVILDPILCDALYKGATKKGSTYPTEIHKKDLGSTFLNRMQAHHQVIRGSESAIKKGVVKAIQILTERQQGNKKVTKVSGFETFLMDAESLASELQKKFACSTSVAELPGTAKKGHEVLIQGGVIDHLAKHLVEQYGIPKRLHVPALESFVLWLWMCIFVLYFKAEHNKRRFVSKSLRLVWLLRFEPSLFVTMALSRSIMFYASFWVETWKPGLLVCL